MEGKAIETLIFNNNGITSTQYELTIRGEEGVRYEYEYPTRLYHKQFLD